MKKLQIETGVVLCCGSLETAYRACLWSRFASRIFLKLASFSVRNEDELYEKSLNIQWDTHLDIKTSFAINSTLRGKTRLSNNRFAALRLKDAVVDFFRNLSGERPCIQSKRPELQLHLHLEEQKREDLAEIFIDLSGESLHRRGYRVSGTLAPLKESLAAAIVAMSGWKRGEAMVDPMCGSGTILIEAAMIEGDVAPGLSRPYFGFLGWKRHDMEVWERLIDEASEREEVGLNRKWPLFLGYDADPVAVSAARKNIAKAGLAEHIQIKQAELAQLFPPTRCGVLVSNLPFGERLSEKDVVSKLYRAFGRIAKNRFSTWKLAVFISDPELTDSFTLQWQKKERLYNGNLSCRLLCTSLENQKEPEFVWNLPEQSELPEEVLDFANRLRKNFTRMKKWASKEGVFCYRLYDRDLPEYNFSLDLFEKWFHLQEHAPPKSISDEVAGERMRLAIQAIHIVFGVRSNRLFVKRRERQRGKKQYQKKQSSGKMFEVREGEASFLVNFTDYLDTGLFLDHRPIRHRIFEEARGRRFLNLFAYTGTATVLAALGGASETTTVDLSSTYLQWARKNLALNGFSELKHSLVKADSMEWLRQASGRYDFIFIDPPTFSNTKKEKRVFDVQRDHSELISLAMRRLNNGGLLFFSTNYRRFKLDETLLEEYVVSDISLSTIPYDYGRDKKIHQCWEIRWPEHSSENTPG